MITGFQISLRLHGRELDPLSLSRDLGLIPKYVRAPDHSIIRDFTAETVAGYCCFEEYKIRPGSTFESHFESVAAHLETHCSLFVALREQGCESDLSIALYFATPAFFQLGPRVIEAVKLSQVDFGFDLYQEQNEGKADVVVDNSEQPQVPVGTIWFGGGVDQMRVAVQIAHSDFALDEVSTLLKCKPDAERDGYWVYEVCDGEEPDFDEMVEDLFLRLSDDAEDWGTLARGAGVELVCEFEMERYSRGLEACFKTMAQIGRRQLSLRFCA